MNSVYISKTIATICAGLGLLLSSCSSHENTDNKTSADAAIVVTVATPSSEGQPEVNISGQVEAEEIAGISTRVMGYITKINVKVGDKVSKGQLLATISNQDILAKRGQTDAMITEADAAYRNAQKDLERFTNLYRQQSASAKELENVSLQYTSAKSRLESAKQMRNEVNATLNYTSLIAPFSGVVTQKLADVGNMANPGMPILTLEQSGSYQVSAAVPENAISRIRQGSVAIISISAVNKTIKGTITQISQSSQFSGGQYIIKVQIPDHEKEGLFAGMYANVSIPVASSVASVVKNDQVMVPLSCIEHKDALTGLYTVGNNNTALLRWVRLGKVEGDQVEVLSGLAANEQFIVNAEGRLFNGAAVQIKK
ncbi:efflux RND transporter periplasmic adaptor subunit [Chitinophaga oryziterrae]|uniref:Efflux RND transporter periplasmic adaptor subunit n=1 Tax=Chitinophaga oryziterrae TaxID=1031224 RepID=A0A6N8JGT6_9BACT|nr:efflux RND transporter periplasmic adaptor subunit [Chitinophaga oryziterrae]MVT43546.1 efflux RND transporter periplasmic adaptor subunit [Chitinophaga oryziterrae]